jgi:hypothetical protein
MLWQVRPLPRPTPTVSLLRNVETESCPVTPVYIRVIRFTSITRGYHHNPPIAALFPHDCIPYSSKQRANNNTCTYVYVYRVQTVQLTFQAIWNHQNGSIIRLSKWVDRKHFPGTLEGVLDLALSLVGLAYATSGNRALYLIILIAIIDRYCTDSDRRVILVWIVELLLYVRGDCAIVSSISKPNSQAGRPLIQPTKAHLFNIA